MQHRAQRVGVTHAQTHIDPTMLLILFTLTLPKASNFHSELVTESLANCLSIYGFGFSNVLCEVLQK
jgi:hypothetical protein